MCWTRCTCTTGTVYINICYESRLFHATTIHAHAVFLDELTTQEHNPFYKQANKIFMTVLTLTKQMKIHLLFQT